MSRVSTWPSAGLMCECVSRTHVTVAMDPRVEAASMACYMSTKEIDMLWNSGMVSGLPCNIRREGGKSLVI